MYDDDLLYCTVQRALLRKTVESTSDREMVGAEYAALHRIQAYCAAHS